MPANGEWGGTYKLLHFCLFSLSDRVKEVMPFVCGTLVEERGKHTMHPRAPRVRKVRNCGWACSCTRAGRFITSPRPLQVLAALLLSLLSILSIDSIVCSLAPIFFDYF